MPLSLPSRILLGIAMGDILEWKRILLIALGATFLIALLTLTARVTEYTFRLIRWDCVPAVFQNWADDRSIEVESLQQDTAERHIVRVASAIHYRAAESLTIAIDPSHRSRAVAMDFANLWRRLLNPACFLVVAVIAWINVSRTHWGEDRIWSAGGWVPTPARALAPAREPHAVVLRSTLGVQRFQLGMLCLFGSFAIGSAYGLFRHGAGIPTLSFILSLAMTLILAGILIDSRTLQLVVSDLAVSEQTFFGAKRIPWTEIHSIQTRNINEKGQRDYDHSDITRFQKGASRPPTVNVDFIVDADGREILSLSDDMEPREAYRALLARIQRPAPEKSRR